MVTLEKRESKHLADNTGTTLVKRAKDKFVCIANYQKFKASELRLACEALQQV